MARSRYQFLEAGYPYFITATIVDWIPLFMNPRLAEIVIDTLVYRAEKKEITIHAWVLMENHLHLIGSGDDLAGSMRNIKSYTARLILDILEEESKARVLSHLRSAAQRTQATKDQKHHIWQLGSHPQQLSDQSIFDQKVDYIHENPVRRGYVRRAEHWRYSSAIDYETAERGLVPIHKI